MRGWLIPLVCVAFFPGFRTSWSGLGGHRQGRGSRPRRLLQRLRNGRLPHAASVPPRRSRSSHFEHLEQASDSFELPGLTFESPLHLRMLNVGGCYPYVFPGTASSSSSTSSLPLVATLSTDGALFAEGAGILNLFSASSRGGTLNRTYVAPTMSFCGVTDDGHWMTCQVLTEAGGVL